MAKGDIVAIDFPFSDLVNAKRRPMLVLAERGEDLIGCAITSNPESDGVLIDSYEHGGLPFVSKVKYWQIHTFLKSLVVRRVARISKKAHKEVLTKINQMLEV